MLTATITLDDADGTNEKLLALEDKKLSNGRAEYAVKRNGKTLTLDVKAKDPVAFRSVMTAITRALAINEKTKQVLEDE
jgi:tRNA threonylcarbamoyladenosine modification (KEOPS) complex  Pcc1 subunit